MSGFCHYSMAGPRFFYFRFARESETTVFKKKTRTPVLFPTKDDARACPVNVRRCGGVALLCTVKE
jgi:hypothetical protein